MLLNNFQEEFKELMLRPRHDVKADSNGVTRHIKSDEISANNRLGVYHNNIVGSLSNTLCATYPMIEDLVGTDFLKEMARQFIFEHPPSGACLHHYGNGFDAFIKGYEPAKDLPYLSDVARFEWAMNHAYYAEDDEALPADALAQIPPEELAGTILNLRQSATLIQSPYPLDDLYKFCIHNGTAPDLTTQVTCRILVYRPHLEVKIVPLSKGEYYFLRRLQAKTLELALEDTLKNHPDFDFSAFLQKHIVLEVFSEKQA